MEPEIIAFPISDSSEDRQLFKPILKNNLSGLRWTGLSNILGFPNHELHYADHHYG